MSLSRVSRWSSSHVVREKTTSQRLMPCFATAGPMAPATSSTISKSLTTIPMSIQSQYDLPPIWFNSTIPRANVPPGLDLQGQDKDRKVKLGRTLRILQERLPTLLQSPLPQEILSPNISLHLFPSTHPFLPIVSGRMPYIAALWTSPIAWNRVPIIGNLKLQVISERMTTQPLHFSPRRSGAYPEQLVVKWRTLDKPKNGPNMSLTEQGGQKLDDSLRGTQSTGAKKEFTGLFIFEFDKDGKVISHTIEHVDQGGEWEKGVGAKVVNLTDWLLGGIKGREPQVCFEISDHRKRGRLR